MIRTARQPRRPVPGLAVLAAGLYLAGCDVPDGGVRPAAAPSAPPPAVSRPLPESAGVPAPPSRPPRRAAVEPDRVLGLTPEGVAAMFGRPAFVRRDPPAEFWRYRTPDCVVELYFLSRGGTLALDHLEIRGDRDGCLDSVIERRMEG